MKLRKRDLFLLVAAPALMLGAIGTVGGVKAAIEATKVNAEGDDAASYTYTKVTSVNQLQDGLLITFYGNKCLMGEQKSNNRGIVSCTVEEDGSLSNIGDGVALFELKALEGENIYAFKELNESNEDTYLYAASSSSNYLKTKSEIDGNASFKITIASDGKATIVAQGSNSHKNLRYNGGSSIFSCYSSGQEAPVLYIAEKPAETFENSLSKTNTLSNLSFNYSCEQSEAAPVVATWPTKTGEKFPKSSKEVTVGAVTIKNTSTLTGDYEEIRVYGGSSLTVSSEKTITKIEFLGETSKPLSKLSTKDGTFAVDSSDKTKATWTGEATKITFSASDQARIHQLSVTYVGDGEVYSFSNVKMQFHYELPHSGDNDIGVKYASDLSSVTEKGLFITDDNETEKLFKTVDKDSFQIAEGKTGHFYKNEGAGEKGMTYTVGVMIPEDKYETELIGVSYVLKNGKYMWGKEKKYSVYQMLNVYSTKEDVSEENQNVCKAFMSYIESNRA